MVIRERTVEKPSAMNLAWLCAPVHTCRGALRALADRLSPQQKASVRYDGLSWF